MLDLKSGDLCDKDWYEKHKGLYIKEKEWENLQKYARKKTRELALSLLDSEYPEERKTGALISGQLKITEAIPRLKELLDDKEYYETSSGWWPLYRKVYYVRETAKEALENMGVKINLLEDWRWSILFSTGGLLLILCTWYLVSKSKQVDTD